MMDTASIYKGIGEVDLGEETIRLQEENNKLLEHIRKLEDDVERLCQEILKMKKDKDALSKNISELFNTAKREIDRKNETINQLREQLDDIYFRRNRAPYNGSSEIRREFNKNIGINEAKYETHVDKRSDSKSPHHSQKEKTKSKTPVRQRSRSSSSSKNCHNMKHSKRDYYKIRSPKRRRSRSRSQHRFKRRRSPSPGNHRESGQRRSPFQRRRSRSREYHSRRYKREEHHSLNSIYRKKKQNIKNSNCRTGSSEVHQEIIHNHLIKDTEINSSKNKHYLVQEFEKLYNEDNDTETDPSLLTDKALSKCAPHDQNRNDVDDKAHSVLAEIYKKSESLISDGNFEVVENTFKTLKKDCDSDKNCLETPQIIRGIITEDSVLVKVKDTGSNDTNTSECNMQNGNSSNVEILKNTENKDCNTSITALQATQQNVGRKRRRCVLKIKE
ncbi:serine/arginine repetitive matrix protein 2-like [Agrilus planipennis]|uniref:Serine/arginine repetitive matrix protein 2-like n=1 Tax=Agrilus planipennis TaxID=224129 RepID=A0A1W4X131_AGRPL|nr:serine/arginine repetitive matrix protein 2-like [Agrilus planipennis]XP_018329804.1 serine/arginine repetitive matrix protein 2-like [Agrilus planipennis]